MKCKIIAYKDTKLNIYTSPTYVDGDRSDEELVEIARRMCANPQLPKVYFDYDLYVLGYFDDKLGKFEIHDPEFLVSLADYKHLACEPEKEGTSDVVS